LGGVWKNVYSIMQSRATKTFADIWCLFELAGRDATQKKQQFKLFREEVLEKKKY
jgi:hypothetical protein